MWTSGRATPLCTPWVIAPWHVVACAPDGRARDRRCSAADGGAAGLGRPNLRIALRFTHYADTVYAAIGGEGVALGWQRLLSGPLSEGRLVRLGQACSDPGEGYHLTVADQYQPGEAAMRAIRWFTEEVGRTALYP